MRKWLLLTTSVLLSVSSVARAADEQPICADRPSKSTGPCTVPNGRWQVETGLVDWSELTSGGVTTENTVWANSAFKYGIVPGTDLELWLTPLVTQSVHATGARQYVSTFGDTLLRVKHEITSTDSPVQVALDPFVKLPTANHHLGNGRIEAGLLVPVQVAVGKSAFTLSLDPELDWLADQDGRGHHVAMIQLIDVGWQATKKLTFSTEIWSQWDWDPSGTGKQRSFDGAVAFLVNNNLQLDGGVNIGLNRQTPSVELYSGLSVRF